MRRFHNTDAGSSLAIAIVSHNPESAIPVIQQAIHEEELALQANQVLNNKEACYDIKEHIADLKTILSILRSWNWSRP